MAPKRSTTRIFPSWLISVTVFGCAFSFLTLPHLSLIESIETECPCEEKVDGSEETLVACSARRRSSRTAPQDKSYQTLRTRELASRPRFRPGVIPAIVGHRLSHDLGAPLLI
jgi:hypothetical protein